MFLTTVQVFTANSVVEYLSSDGYDSRIFKATPSADNNTSNSSIAKLLATTSTLSTAGTDASSSCNNIKVDSDTRATTTDRPIIHLSGTLMSILKQSLQHIGFTAVSDVNAHYHTHPVLTCATGNRYAVQIYTYI